MSISFAKIVSGSSTVAGTNAYTQQAVPTSTATSTSGLTGEDVSDNFILTVFTKPYLDAHTLSFPSWRYAYILWFVFITLFVCWTIFHQLHVKMGSLGASFRKIGMRKFSFGKTSTASSPQSVRKTWTTMTISQLFGLSAFLALTFILCYVGPDFIRPSECMFGGECNYHPVNGNSAPGRKRSLDLEQMVGTMSQLAKRRILRYGWSPLTDPLLSGPSYTIEKGLWESSSRVGLIAYALLPLSVALALKQWPMNPFAAPFFTNLGIDRTAFWHRWTGRLIWVLSTVHTGLWSKQMFIDQDPFNEPTWNVAWKWHRLLAGGIAYVFLTLMVAFSFKPLRNRFYEIFYYSHILLTVGFLATIVIHYEALQGWCLLAAGLWALERIVRLLIFVFLNYGRGLPVFGEGRAAKAQTNLMHSGSGGFQVHNVEKRLSDEPSKAGNKSSPYGSYGQEEGTVASRSTYNLQDNILHAPENSGRSVYAYGVGNDEITDSYASSPLPFGAGPYIPNDHKSRLRSLVIPTGANSQAASRQNNELQSIPRGYALAQLLPGKIIRLTLHTPRKLSWKPGQHLMLTIPSVKWWQGHPYSISNAQNLTEQSLSPTIQGEVWRGSQIVLLMSVRHGFTRSLYDSINAKRRTLASQGVSYTTEGKSSMTSGACGGVLLRAQTYLPAGSAARANWDTYSTVILVAAGTGITYALAVLEHLCCGMASLNAALRGEQPRWAGRSGRRRQKVTNVKRVRFVWILKEYSHLAWIASALRRCLDISDPSRLRIDLFVTRDLTRHIGNHDGATGSIGFSPYASNTLMTQNRDNVFQPPRPQFARGHGRGESIDSSTSDLSQTVAYERDYSNRVESTGDPSSSAIQADGTLADLSITDMVLFEGEEDLPISAADEEISKTVKKEGKLRRALSRKKSRGTTTNIKGSKHGPSLSMPRRSSRLALDADTSDDERGNPIRSLSPRRAQEPQTDRSYNSSGHQYPPTNDSPMPSSNRLSWSRSEFDDTHSISGGSGYSMPRGKRHSTAGLLGNDEGGALDMNDQDREDLNIIAELARGGRPDLDSIFDQEIERSQGRIVVGCCGPQTVNNLIRGMVAKRISPSRIVKGDPRGSIELIAEDFAY